MKNLNQQIFLQNFMKMRVAPIYHKTWQHVSATNSLQLSLQMLIVSSLSIVLDINVPKIRFILWISVPRSSLRC